MTTDRYILGIESSCDETACALVDAEGVVHANSIASQIELHAQFGGIVPEEASRRHIEVCLPLIETMLAETEGGVGWDQIEGIAVTQGPGLIGCLLIGVETAKALAWSHDKPLYAVHHLEAHLHAPFLLAQIAGRKPHLLIRAGERFEVLPFMAKTVKTAWEFLFEKPKYPHVGLVVSGGHTTLFDVRGPAKAKAMATTLDDAAGEAYDKIARLLGLGFPGGPVVDRLAAEGDPNHFPFTPPMMRRDRKDFSFSGLKSAVARKFEELRGEGPDYREVSDADIKDLCAGFQAAAVEVLIAKSLMAARDKGVKDLVVAGGVASNRALRSAFLEKAPPDLRVWFPHISLCTDNAAMIAGLAWHLEPLAPECYLALNPESSLPASLDRS